MNIKEWMISTGIQLSITALLLETDIIEEILCYFSLAFYLSDNNFNMYNTC